MIEVVILRNSFKRNALSQILIFTKRVFLFQIILLNVKLFININYFYKINLLFLIKQKTYKYIQITHKFQISIPKPCPENWNTMAFIDFESMGKKNLKKNNG
jgi:hypothetical protein